jgi:hypothetical protein
MRPRCIRGASARKFKATPEPRRGGRKSNIASQLAAAGVGAAVLIIQRRELSSLVSFVGGGFVGDCEGSGTLRVDGPDFVKQTAVQTGIALGDLRGFFEAAGHDEPVAADHFLGFAKRPVRRPIPRNRFPLNGKPLSGFHLSLLNQSVQPPVELVDRVLDFLG